MAMTSIHSSMFSVRPWLTSMRTGGELELTTAKRGGRRAVEGEYRGEGGCAAAEGAASAPADDAAAACVDVDTPCSPGGVDLATVAAAAAVGRA